MPRASLRGERGWAGSGADRPDPRRQAEEDHLIERLREVRLLFAQGGGERLAQRLRWQPDRSGGLPLGGGRNAEDLDGGQVRQLDPPFGVDHHDRIGERVDGRLTCLLGASSFCRLECRSVRRCSDMLLNVAANSPISSCRSTGTMRPSWPAPMARAARVTSCIGPRIDCTSHQPRPTSTTVAAASPPVRARLDRRALALASLLAFSMFLWLRSRMAPDVFLISRNRPSSPGLPRAPK